MKAIRLALGCVFLIVVPIAMLVLFFIGIIKQEILFLMVIPLTLGIFLIASTTSKEEAEQYAAEQRAKQSVRRYTSTNSNEPTEFQKALKNAADFEYMKNWMK